MKGNKFMSLLARLETATKKNSPTILTGAAIVGVISTAYSAYKAGSRADKILESYRKDIAYCHPNDKEAKKTVIKETVKDMVPIIAPPVIMGGTTIACVIGSHSISSRRIAVLSAAYGVAESAVKNLNFKMEEILGEKKTKVIKDSIVKDKLKASSEEDKKILSNNTLIIPDNGDVLCKDMHTGRLFYSTAEKIRTAILKCSYDIQSEMYISLNDFYEAINSTQLERIPLGDDLGWNIDDTIGGQLPITLSALLIADSKPCICVDYDINVRADFRHLH